jgi:hypothetical protein
MGDLIFQHQNIRMYTMYLEHSINRSTLKVWNKDVHRYKKGK